MMRRGWAQEEAAQDTANECESGGEEEQGPDEELLAWAEGVAAASPSTPAWGKLIVLSRGCTAVAAEAWRKARAVHGIPNPHGTVGILGESLPRPGQGGP